MRSAGAERLSGASGDHRRRGGASATVGAILDIGSDRRCDEGGRREGACGCTDASARHRGAAVRGRGRSVSPGSGCGPGTGVVAQPAVGFVMLEQQTLDRLAGSTGAARPAQFTAAGTAMTRTRNTRRRVARGRRHRPYRGRMRNGGDLFGPTYRWPRPRRSSTSLCRRAPVGAPETNH